MSLFPSSSPTHSSHKIDGQKQSLNSPGLSMDQKTPQITQNQDQKHQNQEPLRCPRCDSSNTKFCYYNNYSLSQPRHFCKGCKRYWTRGGTLRNVPVGGGCRKNKRVKISSANTHDQHVHRPPVFGMHTNPNSEFNFPFSTSRYDHINQNPSQIHDIGLGYSSSASAGLGFHTANPLMSSSLPYTHTSPTLSSLLASTHEMKGNSTFQTLLPSYSSDVKMELEGQNRNLHHNWGGGEDQDSSLLWGGGGGGINFGAWLDPSNNIGSSVPSLI